MSGETGLKTRILLADGHHLVRQGIRRILQEESDFEVVGEASDGEQAVRLTRELKPDVVVMEARLGRMDSVETTKRIKAQHPGAAILVLTACDDEQYIVDMLKAGAGGCLLKSADSEQLVQAIRAIGKRILVVEPTVEQRILRYAGSLRRAVISSAEYLTPRELEVLKLAATGISNRSIAFELALPPAPSSTIWLTSTARCT